MSHRAMSQYPGVATPINLRVIVQTILGFALFYALFLFLPAGSWSWERGWWFVLAISIELTAAAIYLWRVNPEIYVARARIHRGSKRWDLILVGLLLTSMFVSFLVAAFDGGRFHWSVASDAVVVVGDLLLLAGIVLTTWAEGVNKFFEPTVRIQTDRGHHVIDTGPYAYVRHPGYSAAFFIFAGIALALGSWWALVPAAVASGILVLRTVWEEQTLRAELPGYCEYASRVRYRYVPGVV